MDYPAKIILFGEYGIILNSKALAIPFPRFSGRLKVTQSSDLKLSKKALESNAALSELNNYFKNYNEKFKFLDLIRFNEDVNQGLYFDSSIPSGSGLGSSGALTAALYDKYCTVNHLNDLQVIKNNLADIESCFHGISSGTDPFISWIQKPVLLENDSSPNASIDLSPFLKNYTLFLINSHAIGNTGALVNLFMKNYQQPDYKEKIDHHYLPIINQTIEAVLAADFSTFESSISKYSQFQLNYLGQMISPDMVNFFKHGNESGDFYLKICGSGGGGFILGISSQPEKAEAYFNLNHLDYLIV